MKNKTLRTNSMKLKTVIAASLAISVLFAFTGCGNSSTTDNTNTKQESSSTTETGSADELNEKRNDLYQQENQLFVDHKDAWDKAFGLMNKNAAGDAMSENYADSLASTVESNKDSFSEEEYETLCKDIETIRGIEEEIAKLEKEIAASDSSDSSSSKSDESTAVFKGFKGKDLDGNDVDDSLFAKNKVTVVNFWFSGCKPCVGELSKLKAVILATDCHNVGTAIQISENLDDYLFEPDQRNPEEVASEELRLVVDEQSRSILKKHVSLYNYGLDVMAANHAVLTPYGLVQRRDGNELLQVQEHPSERNGMEMMQ